MFTLTPEQEKFFSNVELDWECWIWTGYHEGLVPRFNKPMACRWIIEQLCDVKVLRTEVVTMLCGRPSCVNPDHAKVWPRSEMLKSRPHIKKTHCSKGHALNVDDSGCNECVRDRYRSNAKEVAALRKERRERNAGSDRPPLTPAPEKKCPSCQEVKARSMFYKDRTRDDWLAPYCKACTSEKNRKYRETNSAAVKKAKTVYRQSPMGISSKRASEARRTERLRSLGPMRNDLNVVFDAGYGRMCVKCNDREWSHVDHIIPVSIEGSSNSVENLQPLCYVCNIGKGNRESVDYRPYVMTDVMADRLLKEHQ